MNRGDLFRMTAGAAVVSALPRPLTVIAMPPASSMAAPAGLAEWWANRLDQEFYAAVVRAHNRPNFLAGYLTDG